MDRARGATARGPRDAVRPRLIPRAFWDRRGLAARTFYRGLQCRARVSVFVAELAPPAVMIVHRVTAGRTIFDLDVLHGRPSPQRFLKRDRLFQRYVFVVGRDRMRVRHLRDERGNATRAALWCHDFLIAPHPRDEFFVFYEPFDRA